MSGQNDLVLVNAINTLGKRVSRLHHRVENLTQGGVGSSHERRAEAARERAKIEEAERARIEHERRAEARERAKIEEAERARIEREERAEAARERAEREEEERPLREVRANHAYKATAAGLNIRHATGRTLLVPWKLVSAAYGFIPPKKDFGFVMVEGEEHSWLDDKKDVADDFLIQCENYNAGVFCNLVADKANSRAAVTWKIDSQRPYDSDRDWMDSFFGFFAPSTAKDALLNQQSLFLVYEKDLHNVVGVGIERGWI